MIKALNSFGKMIDIIESKEDEEYKCPICKEQLIRKFGKSKQYFAHPKGLGENCELKMKLIIKQDDEEISEDSINILEREYYNKSFDNVSVELSNYQSEDGYYLTKEQVDIIFSPEERIKVSALAGSAKTSTLYYYAKERPHKKILYLVYNKAMKDEALKTFGKLSHVDIKTIHGLAYGYVGRFYKEKLTFSYGVVDIIRDLNLHWNADMELAVKVDKMMKEYMLSDVAEFEDVQLFLDENNNTTKERNEVIDYCKKLWQLKQEYSNSVKIEHDFYLKLFQLSKPDLSKRYDIICLDEAQDSNMLVYDVLINSNVKGIVVIGDSLQQIYGWRKAINIMPKFKGKEYKLTTSFRVSQNIANIANLIVNDITSNIIDMKGFNSGQKIVNEIDKSKPYVCLCRTNSYIFAEVFDILAKNPRAKLFFEGGFKSYNFQNIKDAYYFHNNNSVNNSLFNKFRDYYEMIEYAENVEDLELLALNRMVTKYGSKIPRIVDNIRKNTVTNKSNANVIFSTMHRSKGQTYNIPVYISDDHFNISKVFIKQYIDQVEDFDINGYYEEMCILYVAITRAAGQIQLSDKVKEYLLLRYQFYNESKQK